MRLTVRSETFKYRHAFVPDDRRKTLKLEYQTRNALYRLDALVDTMKNELGLLPVRIVHSLSVFLPKASPIHKETSTTLPKSSSKYAESS